MKLYLSGPMSTVVDFESRFGQAAEVLRSAGHVVVNPAELSHKQSWQACLRRDLSLLAECDAVAVMPGWETSGGALAEAVVMAAICFGLPVYEIINGDLRPALLQPESERAREIMVVIGAAALAILRTMSQATAAGKHGPWEWAAELPESHSIKGARHALRDYLDRGRPDPNGRVAEAIESLTRFMEEIPEARSRNPRASTSEDHGPLAVCRAAMAWAVKLRAGR